VAVKARELLWAASLAGGAAAIGYAAVRTPLGRDADRELFAAVNRDHGPRADRFFLGVTELGSMYAAASAAVALAAIGERRQAIRALSAAGATWLVGQGLKKAIDRPRPYNAEIDGLRTMIAEPLGTSWPSSHPAVLTAFTRVAARELGLGTASRGVLSVLDLSVAASRVYLGVHYPSDAVSGVLMGRAVARVWPSGRRSVHPG
jgi:membrane-associated phospholipid phosphatase